MPKAIKTVFWRILLFYIGSIFVVGTLIRYTDPNLLNADESHIAFSPFTMVFQQLPRFGFYAANLMNAVILSSVLSCGNSSHVRGLANAVRHVSQPQGAEIVRPR